MDAAARKQLFPTFRPNARLKYYRGMRHWTQANVAEELYKLCRGSERERGIINANMVGGWERGEHIPSPFWQKKLCLLFKTTSDDLGFLTSASGASPTDDTLRAGERPANSQLDDASYQSLARYLQQQRSLLTDALAPGSHSLKVGDIIDGKRLFIPLPWENTFGQKPLGELVEYLVGALLRGQRLLIFGDAGQGKTTVLKQTFARLADRFLADPSQNHLFPIYLPLREIPSFAGNALEVLWECLSDDFPLSYEQFVAMVRSKQVIFLYDGFDEIRGEVSQRLINERASCKIFTYPSVLTCRRNFFEFYLSMSPLLEWYPSQVELLPLTLTGPVLEYIAAFCRNKQKSDQRQKFLSQQKIVETIQANLVLSDLAQRPLLLLMMLEVFTDPKEVNEVQWSITKLYQEYTQLWLKHEASKPDSMLKWHEKALLLQDLAWFSYMERSIPSASHMSQHVAITHDELVSFVQSISSRFPRATEQQLFDDLCFRTLLGMPEGTAYSFLHKSFLEYYVARYAFECMRGQDLEAIERVFQASLPFEIALFLKDILKESVVREKPIITANLMNVYRRNQVGDQRATIIRQQASHYLTSLGTETAIHFLEQVCEDEQNKWVQRGILVGLAYYSGRGSMLDRYILMLRDDQEAAAINLNYHLAYYGDQTQDIDAPLQEIVQCDKTVKALFRHLRNEDYKMGWALDILTLSALLAQQGTAILYIQEWQIPFLKDFLQTDHSGLGEIFQQEKNRLKRLLDSEGVIHWI